MPMRRGTTLAELIVALVLASLVCGLVARSLTAQRRSERAIANLSASVSTIDESIGVIVAALERVAAADTVQLRGDTAIDFGMTIGAGVACRAGADSVVLLDDGNSAWWETSPDSGDTIDAMTWRQWWRTEIVSARTRTTVAGACSGSQRILRLRSPGPDAAELPLIRVTRRVRFMVYRGGDGAWWFGERTCSPTPPFACSAAQPVSGPLSNARGLRFSVDTIAETPILIVTATAGTRTRTAVIPLRP